MEIIDHVKNRFGLDISSIRLTFVKLPSGGRKLKPDNYPSFTMLWQALASVTVVFEALILCPCDVFIDTMGIGYAYPFVKLFFGPKLYSYTHYPLISNDMMNDVTSG
jgi:alpha-1,2-mannosyltransferase